jgi:hypothetical protein
MLGCYKEHVADSQEAAPSIEEVRAPPQQLRRLRRGLGGEELDAVALPSAFASAAEYLQHVSFLRLIFSFRSPRVCV